VETIFRDTKQYTGLGACQCYSDAAMVRHLGWCCSAWSSCNSCVPIPAKASPPSRNDGS
jgi:hypothetical protein